MYPKLAIMAISFVSLIFSIPMNGTITESEAAEIPKPHKFNRTYSAASLVLESPKNIKAPSKPIITSASHGHISNSKNSSDKKRSHELKNEVEKNTLHTIDESPGRDPFNAMMQNINKNKTSSIYARIEFNKGKEIDDKEWGALKKNLYFYSDTLKNKQHSSGVTVASRAITAALFSKLNSTLLIFENTDQGLPKMPIGIYKNEPLKEENAEVIRITFNQLKGSIDKEKNQLKNDYKTIMTLGNITELANIAQMRQKSKNPNMAQFYEEQISSIFESLAKAVAQDYITTEALIIEITNKK